MLFGFRDQDAENEQCNWQQENGNGGCISEEKRKDAKPQGRKDFLGTINLPTHSSRLSDYQIDTRDVVCQKALCVLAPLRPCVKTACQTRHLRKIKDQVHSAPGDRLDEHPAANETYAPIPRSGYR